MSTTATSIKGVVNEDTISCFTQKVYVIAGDYSGAKAVIGFFNWKKY